jgi:hypothetical protein
MKKKVEVKIMNKFISGLLIAAFFAVLAPSVQAGQSKYASHATAAALNFGPSPYGQQEVSAIFAKSDKATAAVKLYMKGGAEKALITAAPTSGAVTVSISNSGNAFTTNDLVVYVHGDGTLLYTTVSGNTTDTVTMATGLTQAGAVGDALYELTQQGEFSLGTTALNEGGHTLWVVPADSPLRVLADGNTNVVVNVTIK